MFLLLSSTKLSILFDDLLFRWGDILNRQRNDSMHTWRESIVGKRRLKELETSICCNGTLGCMNKPEQRKWTKEGIWTMGVLDAAAEYKPESFSISVSVSSLRKTQVCMQIMWSRFASQDSVFNRNHRGGSIVVSLPPHPQVSRCP
jgi:hypothetical protein